MWLEYRRNEESEEARIIDVEMILKRRLLSDLRVRPAPQPVGLAQRVKILNKKKFKKEFKFHTGVNIQSEFYNSQRQVFNVVAGNCSQQMVAANIDLSFEPNR